jgi:desulfoferrodoxin (superoxide reductase-like protein)
MIQIKNGRQIPGLAQKKHVLSWVELASPELID